MTPAEKQEVIWMFLDQGLSYKEIAERTGIPYGTVYMHAKRKREHDEADMTGDNSDRHKCRYASIATVMQVVVLIASTPEKSEVVMWKCAIRQW